MAQGNISSKSGKKGGLDINGILKNYSVYNGETINAGDFVQPYTQNYSDIIQLGTRAAGTSDSTVYTITTNKIDENRVFTSYISSGYIYSAICTIEGNSISVGTPTRIETWGGATLHSTNIGNDNIILITGTNIYLLQVVDTTVNLISNIDSGIPNSYGRVLATISNDKALLIVSNAYDYTTIGYTNNAYIITVNNGVITISNPTKLPDMGTTKKNTLLLKIDDNNFLYASTGGSTHVIRISVTNDVITSQADYTTLASYKTSYDQWATAGTIVNNTDFIIVVSDNSGPGANYLYCKIENENITLVKQQKLSDSIMVPVTVKYLNDKIYITYTYNNAEIKTDIYNINSDKSITLENSLSITNRPFWKYNMESILLNGNIFTVYMSQNRVNLSIVFTQGIKKVVAGSTILGVANTDGTEGQTIEVYVPNT